MQVSIENPLPGATILLDSVPMKWVTFADDAAGIIRIIDLAATRARAKAGANDEGIVEVEHRGRVEILAARREYHISAVLEWLQRCNEARHWLAG